MTDAIHVGSGKVRELYALGPDRLLLVASDRISTLDVVLPTGIPDKGRVLTGLSAFWFARTRELCPNHLLAVRPDCRSTGLVCGHTLPAGLRESDRLAAPIFTPATKAQSGHDLNITRDEAADLVGAARLALVERLSLALYRFAADFARERGIIIADTKFEFGADASGQIVLA